MANLAICFGLGFGVERNGREYATLLLRLDPDVAARTANRLEEFKAKSNYQTHTSSKFRTALEMGHLDSLDLAQVYASSEDVEAIEAKCEKESVEVKHILGNTHHIACTLTATLASLYHIRDKLKSAASLQKSLLDLYRQKYGEVSRHTQSAKINLAVTYREIGQYSEAETLFSEVFANCSKDLGAYHIDTLLAQSDLATTYLTRGKWDQAEQSLYVVVQQSVTRLGVDHPHSIIMRGNLASALQNNGKLVEAEEEQKLTLESSRRLRGEAHIDTITCISNLMSIYNDLKLVDAKTDAHLIYTELAARNAANLFGSCHSFTHKVQGNVAQAYIDRDRYEDADTILRKNIAQSAEAKGENHPDTLTMLGTRIHILVHQEKWAEAEELSLELLASMNEQHNPDYPVVLGNLAVVYSNRRKFSMAVEAASKAHVMQLSQCGETHRLTLLAQDRLRRYQAVVASESV
jgi:tetratricopeptide (TPR) repeat protein